MFDAHFSFLVTISNKCKSMVIRNNQVIINNESKSMVIRITVMDK